MASETEKTEQAVKGLNEGEVKYHKDQPFNDPVVICDSCAKVQLVANLGTDGSCENCGNTRVRNINKGLNRENSDQVRKWFAAGLIDPLWMQLFKEVPEPTTDGVK